MVHTARSSLLAASVLVVLLVSFPANSDCQSLDLLLNKSDKANLDLAASHVAQKIQEGKLAEGKPTVLVIDFYRGSAGTSSLLGSQLADRLSDSLSDFSGALAFWIEMFARVVLTREWATLESLQSNGVCLGVGREVGASGVISGKVFEQNGFIALASGSDCERSRKRQPLFKRLPPMSDSANQAELRERSNAVIKADFFSDFAVLNA